MTHDQGLTTGDGWEWTRLTMIGFPLVPQTQLEESPNRLTAAVSS